MKIPQNKWVQLNKGDKSGNIFTSWNLDVGETLKPAPRHDVIFDDNDAGLGIGVVDVIIRSDADGTDRWWGGYSTGSGALVKSSSTGLFTSPSNWEIEAEGTLNYDGQTGNFTVGDTLTGGTSGATGTIVSDDDNGTTGTLGLVDISGTFQNDEGITDPSGGNATANGTVTDTDAPNQVFDLVNFRGDMIASQSQDLARLDGSANTWDSTWWTSTLSQSNLDSTADVVLDVPDFINNWLLVGNGNKLHVIAKNLTDNSFSVLGGGEGRIVLPSEHEIKWIRSSSNRVWIGTEHTEGGEGKVFSWNARDVAPSNAYGIKSEKTYSCVIDDNIPFTVNNKGQLLAYSGGAFEEISRLPIANQPLFQSDSDAIISKASRLSDDAIKQRGMALIEDKIHIFTSGETTLGSQRQLNEMSAGIYVFDREHGLYHKHSVGQGSVSDDLDYGAPIISEPGAINSLGSNQRGFLYGSQVFTDDTTTINTLGSLSITSNRRGYLVTPRILSSDIKQNFNKLWVVFNQFRKSGEKIIVKYRTEKDVNFPIQDVSGVSKITWSDTDTFTTTNSAYADVVKGNEVIILNGRGAGTTVHIDSISESGGTYTVNLDETISNVSGDAFARVMNWKKIGEIDETGLQSKDFGLDGTAEWVQFKLELRSTTSSYDSPEVDKLELTSSSGQTTR